MRLEYLVMPESKGMPNRNMLKGHRNSVQGAPSGQIWDISYTRTMMVMKDSTVNCKKENPCVHNNSQKEGAEKLFFLAEYQLINAEDILK